LTDIKKYTEILQWHNALEDFDYNPSIDWALELIKNGEESENLLIIASFSKPVDKVEIKPYISQALRELKLNEKYFEYSILANAHYHLEQILNDCDIRDNLCKLSKICLNNNMDNRLKTFYLLYHGWLELEEFGTNHYFESMHSYNIEEVVKTEASIWIDKYILRKEIEEQTESKFKVPNTSKPKLNNESTEKRSLWQTIKKMWIKK